MFLQVIFVCMALSSGGTYGSTSLFLTSASYSILPINCSLPN